MTQLQPTDEMREAFQVAAGWPGPPWRFGQDVANGLAAVLEIAERDLRARIACGIRAELVCCDIYERNQRAGTAEYFCEGPHSICYWGEAAARLAEDVAPAPAGQGDQGAGETTEES